MAIIVQCPKCQQRYAAAEHLVGKQLPCSNCGATLHVPVSDDVPQRPAGAIAAGQAAVASSLVAVCVHCGQRFEAAVRLAGQRMPCPNCGHELSIPHAVRSPGQSEPERSGLLTNLSDLDQPVTLKAQVAARRPGTPDGFRAAARPSPQSSAALDEIPPWLWWAGGGAIGLCVLVFAAMIIGSLFKHPAESPSIPSAEGSMPSEPVLTPAVPATPRDTPPTPAAKAVEPEAASPAALPPVEIPTGVLVYQPQFTWADNSQTMQGTGFLVSTPDRQVVGVSSAHFIDFEGPRLLDVCWCDIRDDRPVVRFTQSLGRPGHAGQDEGAIDLRSDYIILVPDQPVVGRPILELDPRPMPELNERVVLPNKSDREPHGYELREGRVVERDVGYLGVEFDTLFPLQSQSGSPLISKATGRVVGTLSRGGERLGKTVVLVAPASGILAAIRAGDQRFPLQSVVGR